MNRLTCKSMLQRVCQCLDIANSLDSNRGETHRGSFLVSYDLNLYKSEQNFQKNITHTEAQRHKENQYIKLDVFEPLRLLFWTFFVTLCLCEKPVFILVPACPA